MSGLAIDYNNEILLLAGYIVYGRFNYYAQDVTRPIRKASKKGITRYKKPRYPDRSSPSR